VVRRGDSSELRCRTLHRREQLNRAPRRAIVSAEVWRGVRSVVLVCEVVKADCLCWREG
jgi:hypothetical protein